MFKYLNKGKEKVKDAIDFMVDMGVTNDILKEHLMLLCMDPKIVEKFEGLDT